MYNEESPAYRRLSFWAGVTTIGFGLLLWAYPELLSVLVGTFFVGVGSILVGRVLFQGGKRNHW